MELFLLNSTKFKAGVVGVAPGLRDFVSIAVKGTFQIHETGKTVLATEQAGLAGPDILMNDRENSPARYESDSAPFKPRVDALCVGKACAPRGIAVPECTVGFGVGSWFKVIRVVGNRSWVPALGGLSHRMTEPEPFKSMLVSYENAFGGKDAGKPDGYRFYAPNPIGKGYSKHGGGLNNLPLPNLEDPSDPIKSWRSQPRPMSFGPVGRAWEPRIKKAGTYDKRWLKERSPKPPLDFDEAFYNCAPEDQQIQGYLRGSEEVRVQNMHPLHSDFRFRLPGIRIRALLDKNVSARSVFEEIPMNLDTLWVDMEVLRLVLVWRGRFSTTASDEPSRVLLVEEPLDSTPRSPESYRPELLKHEAAEQEAERTIAEAEKELAQLQAERAASTAENPEPKGI